MPVHFSAPPPQGYPPPPPPESQPNSNYVYPPPPSYGYHPQGYQAPPYGYPPQGYPAPHHGYPPQGCPMPPHGYPPQGYPPIQAHAQGHPPQYGALPHGQRPPSPPPPPKKSSAVIWGMRGRGRVNRGREKGHSFSVYVLNIPRLLDNFGLYGIFRKAGRILDTYIPSQSNRKAHSRYGFVRFARFEEARRGISMFNGAIIRGHKLSVEIAKPKKQQQQGRQEQRKFQDLQYQRQRIEWRPKVQSSAQKGKEAIFTDEGQTKCFSITGEVNKDNEVWLKRSLVGTVEEPRDLATLHPALIHGFDPCIKLSALSSYQFLMIFPSEERMEEALAEKDVLLQWFYDIKKWGVEDRCESRRVWLNIVGVPPQGWLWENFKLIAEIWGKLVCLGRSAKATDSFEAMRICIVTKTLQKINSEIVLSLGACGYRVTVTETDSVNQTRLLDAEHMLHKEDDYVPGFEDIEGDEGSGSLNSYSGNQDKVGVEFEDIGGDEESGNHNNYSGNQNQVGVEEAELSFSNSKTRLGQEALRSKESRQATPPLTRTKTVSFSCVGDSEEVFKARRNIKHLVAQEVNEDSLSIDQPPPGFESESQNPPLVTIDQANNERILPSVNYKQALLKGQNCSQQTQLGTENTRKNKSQGLLQEPVLSNHTEETSESLKQLAIESLQIGELLGVKVIGDFDAAISRITKPLKKNRRKKRVMHNEDRVVDC